MPASPGSSSTGWPPEPPARGARPRPAATRALAMDLTLTAILLGVVEGLTEFVPVSSTGHLILATELFGYDAEQWKLFNVVIQLGAILAVVVQYWRTFWAVGYGLLRLNPVSVAFVRNLVVAFIPAAVLGLLLKKQIDA